ncbi:TIGR04283 family arsenosugar biosynthesis glycosyltransferase [Psychroserpens algicola]|uniref:TIGR04283 family arsenosugar biosynthesis glycosyltransferase n=1 Tax=Psychroserpens algicola TaxID=1719034 RepID=A0ABT0H7V1_9FLAO|nr:TIGR04283 family arsenosugar biosynthesis glycosyltransferase [Psychroserpens algicola]MCK8480440.1 TIGR04283 family arsenosugar biosynthesis glycosyltransferase [Psychroserpens algicola]
MISIIIPILNEAETIENLLFHLIDHASLDHISEIIVVDGGSTDGSQALVKNSGLKIKLLHASKGRAKQMNFGAKQATGRILYFLHADSFPPNRYDQLIIDEVKKGHQAGCFRLKFDSNHWWLRLASWLTQFSWRACRGGDQSQFITRELFDEIGGYDERFIIYEDNVLINELYARQQFVVINKQLKTSARLYRKHGIWKLQYHFWTIYVKKWFGASADDLFVYYKKHIC